ncbi:MAG: bacterioferritin-associated ferredoxin [Planctomycetota bacterium]
MPRDIEIDRCVCYDVRFAELKEIAERERSHANPLMVDDLSKRLGCGSCCGLCRPYIERMLETGETVFNEVIEPRERAKPH